MKSHLVLGIEMQQLCTVANDDTLLNRPKKSHQVLQHL